MDSKEELRKYKAGATWVAMMELSDFIKWNGIAKKMGKSNNWILQRLHGYEVNGKKAEMTEAQYVDFVKELRELADVITRNADAIEKADKEF